MAAGSELGLPLALFFPLFRFFFLALVAAGVELEIGGVVPFCQLFLFNCLSSFNCHTQLQEGHLHLTFFPSYQLIFEQKVCADVALS